MLKIGLTGGLGSGKTTVARIFEVLGIPVYYADEASKCLMNDDAAVKTAVKKTFGNTVYKDDILQRKYLADIVFNDEEKLKMLNSIVHPATIKDAENWIKNQTAPYIIKEAALLFESGSNKNLNHVIGVQSPLALRLQRAMQRDQISEKEIMSRINRQMDEEKKLQLCDFIIVNNEEQMVIPQVLESHEKFLQLVK